MIANYHTHTKRCHHALGTDEKYVKAAIKMGLKTLGFSDHGPWPYEGFVSGMRMTVDESQDYFKSIRKLKEKYKDEIDIKIGFEYEYYTQYIEWLKKFKEENGIDYLILGHHFVPYEIGGKHAEKIDTPEEIYQFGEAVVEGIKSGLFLYVAHPDVYMSRYPAQDEHSEKVARMICETAEKYDVPLEYNILGLRKSSKAGRELYPSNYFWTIAREYNIRVIVGVDAHAPHHLKADKYILKAESNLKKLGIKVTERLI